MNEVDQSTIAGVKIAAAGTAPELEPAAVEALRARLRGNVLRPGDAGYSEARRVWNGMIDRTPALIVRCGGAADVIAAVGFAREHRLPVAVRCGGHNVSGSAVCDGGLVIDLGAMNGVRVDPERRRVRVEGGARLGDLDHETQAFGLAVPVGVVSRTGVAGLALHGGMGFLTRRHGLTSDNLVAADVVTADGRLLAASQENHADLYWALRGGGGNFGVVTSFEFQAHPVGPDVWVAMTLYPAARAPEVVRLFRDFMAAAPEELMALAIYWSAPHDESIPEAHQGEPVIVLVGCYSGPFEQGEAAIQPLREVTTPVADLSGPMGWLDAQRLFDPEYPDGRRYYWKSIYLDNLDERVLALLGDFAARRPSPISSIDVWALGGALMRTPAADTAFAERNAPYLIGIEANWDDPARDDANVAWAREQFEELQRFSSGGSYLNFPGFGEEGDELMRRSYAGNYERLRAVKAKYDPENFFRHNLNIRP